MGKLLKDVVGAEVLIQDSTAEILSDHMEKAEAIVKRYLSLVVMPDNSSALRQLLAQSQFCLKQPTATVGCIYTVQHCGEADSWPHCRIPPFRQEHMKLVVNAITQPEPAEGRVFCKSCKSASVIDCDPDMYID